MAGRRILVTGTRAPAGSDIARLMVAAGHHVHAGDSVPLDLAGAIPRVSFHRLPAARPSPAAYGRAVAALVAAEGIDLVVPTCEEIFYLAAARDQGHEIPLFAPDLPTLRRLHDKCRFIELAESLGLAVPWTRRLESRAEALALAERSRDLVFKPIYSRFGTRAMIGRRHIDGLRPSPEMPWVAQERLEGQEICLYAIADRGRLTAFSAYRPLYRLGQAASYYFEPEEAPDGEALARRLVTALGYSGQIAFDAIRTPEGYLLPIECNPRATSGVHLLADVPGLVSCFTGQAGAGEVLRPQVGKPVMLASAMILFGLPRALAGGLGAWRRDFARARDVLAPARLNRRALQVFAAYGAEALRRRTSLRAVATRDIEWDGEAIHAGT
jgi:ATP-grasp domain